MPFDFYELVKWGQYALDIALVTYVIYKTLSLLVGTRAMQLVKGLIVLTLMWGTARLLRLDTFYTILSHIFSALLIIVTVIFQPELRRILEELGRSGMWRQTKVQKEAEVLADSICSGLLYCCAHKIGALIVFQRETGLKEYWQNAVILNAQITRELLIAIFWPNNPLHDGAIIIDGDNIIAAGCYLPLTENTDLPREQGTRHRAAIGITEVSDAISIIVSEERGEITLATKGWISQSLSEPQVKKFLVQYFADRGKDQNVFESLRDEFHDFAQ